MGIQVLDLSAITGLESDKPIIIPKGIKNVFTVPTQIDDSVKIERIETTSEAVSGTVATFVAFQGFILYFLQPVLNFLWGLINCLQVIVLTALFDMPEMPLNLKHILVALL